MGFKSSNLILFVIAIILCIALSIVSSQKVNEIKNSLKISENDEHEIYESESLKKDRSERVNPFPLKTLDYVGIPTLSILTSLATSAGIGGGEIVVPIIKILFDWSQLEASELSTFWIMIASLTRFILHFKKKHPYKNAVAADYNAAMLLMPAIFLGASVGLVLHSVIPEFYQELVLLALIALCTVKSVSQGMQIWKKETIEREERKLSLLNKEEHQIPSNVDSDNTRNGINKTDITSQERTSLLEGEAKDCEFPLFDVNKYDSSEVPLSPIIDELSPVKAKNNQIIERLQKQEQTHWQFGKLLPIWLILVAQILQSLFKDSQWFKQKDFSLNWWLLYIGYIIVCMLGVVYCYFKLRNENELKKKIHFPHSKGEVHFTANKIAKTYVLSIFAGGIAAMIGVGGGILYVPLLLMIGYHPFVAGSTSMLIIMYASLSNTIAFYFSGDLKIGFALWLSLWTWIGVVLGLTITSRIVAKTGRQSILIFILGGIMTAVIIFSIVFMIIGD